MQATPHKTNGMSDKQHNSKCRSGRVDETCDIIELDADQPTGNKVSDSAEFLSHEFNDEHLNQPIKH